MIREIIDKWKLNRALLASKMGMSKGYFNNKLSETAKYRLTSDELNKLKGILIELRNDLEVIDEIEFNQALEMLVKKDV